MSSIVAMYNFVFTLRPFPTETHMEERTLLARLVVGTKASPQVQIHSEGDKPHMYIF
jgi:hypothetical protein